MQEEEPLARGHFVATERFDDHLVTMKSWLRDNHFADIKWLSSNVSFFYVYF